MKTIKKKNKKNSNRNRSAVAFALYRFIWFLWILFGFHSIFLALYSYRNTCSILNAPSFYSHLISIFVLFSVVLSFFFFFIIHCIVILRLTSMNEKWMEQKKGRKHFIFAQNIPLGSFLFFFCFLLFMTFDALWNSRRSFSIWFSFRLHMILSTNLSTFLRWSSK